MERGEAARLNSLMSKPVGLAMVAVVGAEEGGFCGVLEDRYGGREEIVIPHTFRQQLRQSRYRGPRNKRRSEATEVERENVLGALNPIR